MAELIRYSAVELRQLEHVVLSDVNLSVNNGELVYLLGRVGSGKSTLMKSFYAEVPIFSGSAQVLGYEMCKIKRREIPYLRRQLGIVFQDFQLLTDRTVEDNLMFVLRATGWSDKRLMKTHVQEVLSQVGMAQKNYKMPHQLSGGEQQRVVIARALLNSPQLILADEPTGNLDAETGAEIMELLMQICKAGTTVIISTHNMNWVEQYKGRNLYFKDGHVKEGER
ncbi:MAG: ATP-binding cassette domain-containing protein [Paludibacteraceae bacterium]|nr:ATP-binding cassette domain-containing protein [Paludibacteraceae bacterium]